MLYTEVISSNNANTPNDDFLFSKSSPKPKHHFFRRNSNPSMSDIPISRYNLSTMTSSETLTDGSLVEVIKRTINECSLIETTRLYLDGDIEFSRKLINLAESDVDKFDEIWNIKTNLYVYSH